MADKVQILAVDDSSISLATIERELKNEKYEVIPVNSGLRALQYLKRKKADLIILDIQMASMDGIETLKEIRGMEDCRDIPVIMLTSKRDRKTVMESSKLGICDYVLKPFSKQDLQTRVERVLKKVRENTSFIEQLRQGSISLDSLESLGSLESLEKKNGF